MPVQKVLRSQHVPVRMWTDDVDARSQEELSNIASLPLIHHHVVAMEAKLLNLLEICV